ncbi:MAG: hypothetical protein AB1651_08380 [Pseudomonadota bacterium]
MPKRTSPTGSELFIVDNSDEDWKAVRYLRDWCQLSKSIDIATGYFEIGALLALGEEWQKIDGIRILMGDEVSRRTKKALVIRSESQLLFVMPAQAGIQCRPGRSSHHWIPAFAGMTSPGLRPARPSLALRVRTGERSPMSRVTRNPERSLHGAELSSCRGPQAARRPLR